MTPILLALALQASTLAPPPAGGDAAILARYRECTALVTSSPEQAIETANAWIVQGGGVHARACLGLAYVALDRWAPAATVYEQAARAAENGSDARRADFWVQSANAWLAAGEPQRAVQALDAALATAGVGDELRGEAHLDRARALVALGNEAGARQDLDHALRLVAADPLAWYLSAGLALRANQLDRARTDIARARELGADNPDILLLAGTIAGRSGNMEEAERLYRRLVAQAPDSDAGRQASESLATLREVEVPAPAAANPQPAPTPPR